NFVYANLTATVGVNNPGLQGAADVYLGILRPDGAIQFVTNTGTVLGNVHDFTTFRPIVQGLPLTAPFTVTVPNFEVYDWTGHEPPGRYLLFLLAVKAGALAVGGLASDAILGLSTASFQYP